MKRIGLRKLFLGSLALGLVGVSIGKGGEWYSRRQLPPNLQTHEAIEYYFDGAVCQICLVVESMAFFVSLMLISFVIVAWIVIGFTKLRHTKH